MMIKSSTLDVPFQTAFTNGDHAGVADLPIAKGGAGRALAHTNCLKLRWPRAWS